MKALQSLYRPLLHLWGPRASEIRDPIVSQVRQSSKPRWEIKITGCHSQGRGEDFKDFTR